MSAVELRAQMLRHVADLGGSVSARTRWGAAEAAVYPGLLADGLIELATKDRRPVYQLTDAGRAAVAR